MRPKSPLAKVVENFDSKRIPLSSRERQIRKGNFPYYGAAGCIDFIDDYLFDGLYLLVGEDGSVVKADGTAFLQLVSGKFWVNNHAHVLQGADEIETKFAYYALSSINISGLVTGAVQPKLTQANLNSIEIPHPDRSERERIVAVLGTLDDKIELNRKMNATLEAMARALFKSWFVDFDPVRAKMEGRQPEGMDAETAALFPDEFEESELGLIPRGWELKPLSKMIEILSGGTPKTTEPAYWDGDIPWFSVKDVPAEGDVWVIDTEKKITQTGVDNSAAKVLPAGTTIISARGTVGKLALTGAPMAMNQSCYGIRGAQGYGDYFTYFCLREAVFGLQQRTHGSVFDTITRQTFETLDWVSPPSEATSVFDKAVAPILARIRSNLHKSRILASLRDALLPRLLYGDIRLSVFESEPVVTDNVIPFPTKAHDKPKRETPDEFKEAVLIAEVVRKFSSPQYPLGRMRYNKFSYLAHRKVEDDVQQHYLKQAAGPYSPWAKYEGPERIALGNGYILHTKVGKYDGFLPGPKVGDIDRYLGNYPACGAIEWVSENFRYKRKDELEVITTVDFAVVDLQQSNKPVTARNVKQVIAANPNWAPKLDRSIFSDENISKALRDLAGWLPALYGGQAT